MANYEKTYYGRQTALNRCNEVKESLPSFPLETNGPPADKKALRAFANGEGPDQYAQDLRY